MAVVTVTSTVRKPGAFPPGRRCVQPGCITVLCTYDAGPRCFTCEARHAKPRPEPTTRELMEAA